MPVRERRDDLRSLYTPGSRKYWELKCDSARVLYGALKANADDEGKLEGESQDVKSLVPRSEWTLKQIERDLQDMVRVGLIERYEVGTRTYIQVVKFVENQVWQGLKFESSKIPSALNGRTATEPESQSSRSPECGNPMTGMDGKPSIHTRQNHTEPILETEQGADCAPAGDEVPDPESAYRQARRICRQYVGKSIGTLGPKQGEWNGFVNQHGNAKVEAAVKMWAQDIGKRGRSIRWLMALFLSQKEQWIEDVGVELIDGEDEDRSAGPRRPAVQI